MGARLPRSRRKRRPCGQEATLGRAGRHRPTCSGVARRSVCRTQAANQPAPGPRENSSTRACLSPGDMWLWGPPGSLHFRCEDPPLPQGTDTGARSPLGGPRSSPSTAALQASGRRLCPECARAGHPGDTCPALKGLSFNTPDFACGFARALWFLNLIPSSLRGGGSPQPPRAAVGIRASCLRSPQLPRYMGVIPVTSA